MSEFAWRNGAAHLVCEDFGGFRSLVAINANADLVEDLDHGAKMAYTREVSDDNK